MNIWIITRVTFLEASRRKVLWTALFAGAAFIALFGTGMHYQVKDLLTAEVPVFARNQILRTMMQIGFYAIDLLAVTMTVLVSADAISGEIASSTIHAMAAKPIPRWQLFLGKWLGFAIMITGFVGITFGGVVAVGYFIGQIAPYHAYAGAGLVLFECFLVLTVTFMFGTWFSTLTNGVIVLGLHGFAFIGGWLEQIGATTHSQRLINIGIISSIVMPSEAVWHRAALEMQSGVSRAFDFSPFGVHSAPSITMMIYALLYVSVSMAIALYHFHHRDL